MTLTDRVLNYVSEQPAGVTIRGVSRALAITREESSTTLRWLVSKGELRRQGCMFQFIGGDKHWIHKGRFSGTPLVCAP